MLASFDFSNLNLIKGELRRGGGVGGNGRRERERERERERRREGKEKAAEKYLYE
jgi:hypothetical protein